MTICYEEKSIAEKLTKLTNQNCVGKKHTQQLSKYKLSKFPSVFSFKKNKYIYILMEILKAFHLS